MKRPGRIPEAAMAAGVLALLAALLYPYRPAPLPAAYPAPGASPPAEQRAALPAAGPPPSAAEVAGLFSAPRPGPAPAPVRPAARPERVPWLHFTAFAVGAGGETCYFFKNDQSSRVLMLAPGRPRDGWNLAAVQEDAWVLENGGHRYLVTR